MINTIIDLYHNDNVNAEDWHAVVAGGTTAVIHKASQGIGSKDQTYAIRRVRALAAGLPLWGAYHFADGSDGYKQADHFLDAAQPEPHTLMALDLEDNPGGGGQVTAAIARAFVLRIKAVTGRLPWIYGSNKLVDFAGAKGDLVLCQCPLWIARYGGHAPVVPPGWKTWTLWQYQAGEGTSDPLPGLGHVDRSQFSGTLEELKAIWGK